MNNELLVKSIRELCKKNNIAISQLEGELNFGAGLISRWTKSSPSLDKIVDIAKYFHVSLDEVVGYQTIINDTFLSTLYEQTDNGSIVWENGESLNSRGLMVKRYSDFDMPGTYLGDNEKETTYAVCFKSGYVAMYAHHRYDEILYPYNLILFIQPSDTSFLVDQHYTKEELVGLWVKILNSLGDNAPDAVKAEGLKNEFIFKQSLVSNTNKLSEEDNIKTIIEEPAIQQLLELYNKPEFQKMQQVMSSPGFQAAVEAVEKIQKHLYGDKKE